MEINKVRLACGFEYTQTDATKLTACQVSSQKSDTAKTFNENVRLAMNENAPTIAIQADLRVARLHRLQDGGCLRDSGSCV